MGSGLSLAPCGLVIERVEIGTDKLLLVARPISKTAACPICGGISARIHSRYQRALADLPSQGWLVRIRLWTRRFRCAVTECHQKIFTERLEATACRPVARRTTRLEAIVHHLGLPLGGRPVQGIARRLLLPLSKDTQLRVVRRNAARSDAAPQVVGIDDWPWKRGHRYGTIVCGLEKRCIIDILSDREAATVTTWLAEHSTISVIARDRGAGYIRAATQGARKPTSWRTDGT
jgi:transposase